MKHVTDRMTAWVGGELSAAEVTALERHLDTCPACRNEADRLRRDWDALALAAVDAKAAGAGLWPAVRERTFGPGASGWFFGRSQAVRLTLALVTLAVGVVCGRLSGGLAGPSAAVVDDDSGLAAVWLEDSTWHGQAGGGLADSWLALADNSEQGNTAAGRGGTR